MGELGPFTLVDQLGRGGAGAVFRATHRASGLPVAIKVLHEAEGASRHSLLHEVQVTAALHHPRIVRILDFGRVSERETDADRGLAAGEPWMAMEYCAGGTLADQGPEDWSDIRSVLLQILDGLAHAHARGLLHGDIKPGNVLRAAGSRGIKLSDLGIAARFGDAPDDPETVSGTPAYMAPELWEAHWRLVGPATDLYAVGCLAWRMANGKTPFPGRSTHALARAHRGSRPGPWAPLLDVPMGFEDWVRQLLSKSPRRRWDRAAEAAQHLLALDEGTSRFGSGASQDPSLTWDAPTVTREASTSTMTRPMKRVTPVGALPAEPGPAPAKQTTPDWRPARPPLPLQEASGLGSELLPIRAIPFVGRETERDTLWAAWSSVRAEHRPAAIAVRAPEGAGAHALTGWLAERILEVGGGDVVEVDARGGIEAGVVSGLRTLLRANELDSDVLGPWCRAWVGEVAPRAGARDAALLETLLAAPGSPDETGARARSPGVLRSMILRAVELVARRRGLLLLVDGATEDPGATGFLQALLDSETPPRVLVVLLARGGAGDDLMAWIEARPEAALMDLGPLSRASLQRLGVDGLGLHASLASRLAEQAVGHAGAFVEVVRELARRGALWGSAAGLGFDGPLPSPGAGLWRDRLAGLLDGIDAQARSALALGALIGDVDMEVWGDACRSAGWTPPERWLERLGRGGAIALHRHGPRLRWQAVHPAARAVLIGEPPAALLRELHGRAADALARSTQDDDGRIGEHLLAAGRPEEAFERLDRATAAAAQRGELGRAVTFVGLLERAGPAAPPSPGRDAQLALSRARVAFSTRRITEALDLALRARDIALRAGEPRLAVLAAQDAGRACGLLGRMEDSAGLFELGEREAIDAGDRALAAQLANDLGQLEFGRGRTRASERALRRALTALGDLSDDGLVPSCRAGLAKALIQNGELEEAEAELGRARAHPRCESDVMLCAAVLHTQGELARARGRLSDARDAFEEWRALQASIGHPDVRFAEINLAIVLLEQGAVDDAAPLLERCEATLRRGQVQVLLAVVGILRLEVLASGSPHEATTQLLTEVEELLHKSGAADPDLIRSLVRTEERLAQRGAPDLAARIGTLAAEQRRRCGG